MAVPVDVEDNPWNRHGGPMGAAGHACDGNQELNVLDLDFTPEQDMLRPAVRGLCTTYCPLSVVRDLEDDPVGYQPELWKQPEN